MPTKQSKSSASHDACVHTKQASLGEAVGLSQSQISRRLRESDCPITADGPWDADDVRELKDWLEGNDPDAGDRLKRAQAVKAEALAARYGIDMMAEVGTLGNDLFAELGRALRVAMVCHYQKFSWTIEDALVEAGAKPTVGRQLAEMYAREFVLGYSSEVARVFKFGNKLNETLRPTIAAAEKMARDLRSMGDLGDATLDRLDEAIDEAREVVEVGGKGQLLPPDPSINPYGPSDLAPRVAGYDDAQPDPEGLTEGGDR